MRKRMFASLEVRMNEQMAALLSGADLDSYRDMRWIAAVDKTGWSGDLESITREGWVRRPSGALVLKWKAGGRYQESDCHHLGDYERRTNHVYVPDDAIDLVSDDAMAVLAGRGYALTWNFLARVDRSIEHGPLVGVISVSRQIDGKPSGHIQIHEHRADEPSVGMDDLDVYQAEAVMVLVSGPDFDEPWVELPSMLPGATGRQATPLGEDERRRLGDLAARAAACLNSSGLPVTIDAPASAQGGVEIEIRENDDPAPGVYLTWKGSGEWERHVAGHYGAGDILHPDAERGWRIEEAMSRALVAILDAFGLCGVSGRAGRPLEVEVRDPEYDAGTVPAPGDEETR